MNGMQARILKWQEIAKQKNNSVTDFESIKGESVRREQELRIAENIKWQMDKVPQRFRDKTFSDYLAESVEQQKVKSICERFTMTFTDRVKQGSSMMFIGKPGTGKTLISLIMYQSLVQSGFNAQYESSLHFLKLIQQKRFESYSAYQSILEHYQRPHLLILDEVTESTNKQGIPSENERNLLFEVINQRYQLGNRSTLVISNRDKKSISTILGLSIVDRLSENGISLVFDWDSYRSNFN
jgi:DNA replication protein DnaC